MNPLAPPWVRRAVKTLTAGLAMLAISTAHSQPAAEIGPALNAARTLGCGGRPGVAQALAVEPRLSEAARQLADGLNLQEALSRAGYRATRASQLWLGGPQGARAITDAVATNNCAALTDPALSQMGIHQRGRDTWILLAAPFAPVAPAQAGDVAARVLQRVNAARAQARQCGDRSFAAAGPVVLNDRLSAVAQGHAADMAAHSYFAHQGRDGSSPSERATRGGYVWRAVGENIAAGQQAPDAAVDGWLRSPPHCANLMGPQYTEMGIAFAVQPASEAGIYWVQMFGTPR